MKNYGLVSNSPLTLSEKNLHETVHLRKYVQAIALTYHGFDIYRM